MSADVSFSVAVPCYNYGRYLEACVGAALSQRGADVAVLIVDDCSTDNTAEVGARLAEDPRVTYTRHAVNQGHIATFNEGVDWASNEFFVLISADDILAPGAFARAGAAFRTHPNVGMVYGGIESFVDSVEQVDVGDPDEITVYEGWDWIERRCRRADNSTHSPEIFLRTAVQQQIGHYDEQCRHTSDLNMWLRAAAVSDIAYLPKTVQAYYRIHGENMSRVVHGEKLGQIKQRHVAFERFFEELPSDARNGRLRETMNRRIAVDTLREASRSVERGELETAADLAPYTDLATRVYAGARSLQAYRGLQFRARIGAASRFVPTSATARVVDHFRRKRQWSDMNHRGV